MTRPDNVQIYNQIVFDHLYGLVLMLEDASYVCSEVNDPINGGVAFEHLANLGKVLEIRIFR
jgi:hypothetical protein